MKPHVAAAVIAALALMGYGAVKIAQHDTRNDYVIADNCFVTMDHTGKPLGPLLCQSPRPGLTCFKARDQRLWECGPMISIPAIPMETPK